MKKIKITESQFTLWLFRIVIITILIITGLSFISNHFGGYVIIILLIAGLIGSFIITIEEDGD